MANDNKQTDVKQPSNKVFDLVQFLFDNKDNIKSWEETFEVLITLRKECDNLKPKTKFENDTKYLEKKRELETKEKNSQQIFEGKKIKEIVSKIEGFGFEFNNYKHEFQSITEHWYNNITDANEALEQLKRCRRNYLALPKNAVERLFYYVPNKLFFLSDLDYHLMGSTSDKGLFAKYIPAYEPNKYNGLASDLEPYLKGATGEIIESIIDDKRLPDGAEKPKWEKLTDAKRFGNYFGFTNEQLRDFFDNNIRSNNKPKGKDKIAPILQKYVDAK